MEPGSGKGSRGGEEEAADPFSEAQLGEGGNQEDSDATKHRRHGPFLSTLPGPQARISPSVPEAALPCGWEGAAWVHGDSCSLYCPHRVAGAPAWQGLQPALHSEHRRAGFSDLLALPFIPLGSAWG